ncbi:8454_t:CDS:2 [Entrophospora sp. SA101]|nr:8454_t:CDS:2 [Entrophospora sp. SA101]
MDKFTSKFTLINKSIGQMLAEKLGTAEDVTELPAEYLELERKVDALHAIHTNLLHVTNIYTDSSYDYPNQLQDTVVEFTRNVVASEGVLLFGSNDPLGIALDKFGTMQKRIGEQRVKMDQTISKKFVQPFNTTLNTSIQFAMKARKNVRSTRLALDTAKAKYKSTRPERSEAARLEVEQAEDQFVASVEEATTLMKSILNMPEPLLNLSDLVNAQLAFHKEAYEILRELAPEIDDIHVTQEALYR